jgi:hypothetical protein
MYAFLLSLSNKLESNKKLEKNQLPEGEIEEYVRMFSNINDINAFKQWHLKILQAANEGAGRTVRNYIKHALSNPISSNPISE